MQRNYMTILNNDTITLPNAQFDATSISSSSSAWYNNVMSGTAASDTITINSSAFNNAYGWGGGIVGGGGGGELTGAIYTSTATNSQYYYNGTGSNTWTSTANWNSGTPFETNFPEWNAFRKLCNEYPGLESAYNNLKLCYTICHEDSKLQKENK